ncbi:RNA polymerase sigma factor [Aneurinibacillus terranovensis]|uniref:RNA polymerase sigma factor n=1 Tax=Aneurinibacillus terranovensis TaxID=278991 RepID=UPI000411C8DF|nr:sigma-70 family RNA polymerase sigma factor [Aneurinibacillus terranovensis]
MEQELYEMIRKAKRGDKEAFTQLIQRYKGQVFRHAYAMLQDRMEAEDVAQEAFVKVYFSLKSLESEFAFSSWLTRIVSNLCYTRVQKKKKEASLLADNLEEYIPTPSSRGTMEQKQLQLTIEEAMQNISLDHRTVLVLRDIQGFSYDEIARILDIPVGTVKSRISSARLSLRKEWTK